MEKTFRIKTADRYKGVIELLIDSDIKRIISEMMDMRDQGDVFFDKSKAEDILMRNLSNYDEVSNVVNNIAEKEELEWRVFLDNTSELYFDKFERYDDSVRKRNISERREKIYVHVINLIQAKAEMERGNRVYLRKEKGMSVDFDECEQAIPYNGHVEFYKDGGWGIATSDGIVEIPNNIITRPSTRSYDNYVSFNPLLRVVQSRDNDKYGVVSLSSFEIIMPFEYKRIEEFGDCYNRPKCSLLKVLNDNGWGCFNEKGNNLIMCKYDGLELQGDLIECFRNGDYIQNDELKPDSSEVFYDGKRDLYDKNGDLLIGGYSLRKHYMSDIYYYYFDTSYEDYLVKEPDLWDRYDIDLWKYRINYDKSVCLILDRNLKSVVKSDGKCFQFPKGKCIDSIQELISIVPQQLLFHNEVDFWSGHFIFQKQRLGEKTVVQETRTIKTYHPHTRPATKEEKALSLLFDDKEIEEVKEDYVYSEVTEDVLKEDDRIIISGLSKENDLLWSSCVNEIGKLNGYRLPAYRKGISVGFYSESGLEDAIFAAITHKEGKYYVARLEFEKELVKPTKNNQNYQGEILCTENNDEIFKNGRFMYLRYYEYSDGHLTRMSDDWKVFNPAKLNWFPNSFKDTYRIYDEDDGAYYNDRDTTGGHEWTDEDAWDAMTDGMYGDYPGSGWDSEWFGY